MSTYLVYPTSEQEQAVKEFLETLHIPFQKEDDEEKLPQHVLDGIKRGQEDFKAGRFISYEEFRKRHLNTRRFLG